MDQASPPALVGSTWLAEEIGGLDVVDDARPTISFEAVDRVAGSGGCNRYSGPVTVEGNEMVFGRLNATMKGCAATLMQQERNFFSALSATRSYRFDASGQQLFLVGEGSAILVRLSRPAR